MFRFTIRDLMWLMVVAGLVLVLLPENRRRREAERLADALKDQRRNGGAVQQLEPTEHNE